MKKKYVWTLTAVLAVSSLIVTPVMANPEDEIKTLEIQKKEVQSQADAVQEQLVGLLVNYEALQRDIENQEQQIVQAEVDLEEAEAKERKQYEDMKLRIQYIYEESNDSLFEVLFTAKSFSDLICKAEYVQNVHSYDRQQLQEYQETRQQVADLKIELEAGQADMEVMAAELEEQQEGMEATLAGLRTQIADFDDQLEIAQAAAKAELERLVKESEETVVASDGNKSATGTVENTGNRKQTQASAADNSTSTSKPASSTVSAGTVSAKPATDAPDSTSSGVSASTAGTSVGSASSSSSSGISSGSSQAASSGTPANAALGQQIANKACEYIGNPYVYGGNSLTNGIDCSGFVQQIHALFGISTPRDSWSQLAAGKAVSYADMLPGDVIVYSGHVAIYIGNNTVVHASNSKPYPAGGIKTTSPANYKTVLGVRRYW